MLNYIWSALLILGIVSAVIIDIHDSSTNKFLNNKTFNVRILKTSKGEKNPEYIEFDSKELSNQLAINKTNQIKLQIKKLSVVSNGKRTVNLIVTKSNPELFQEMAAGSGEKNDLSGNLNIISDNGQIILAELTFEKLSFLKIKQVTNSAIDSARVAVEISIGLIGLMALWLGIMKIAEEAGLIKFISKLLRPLTNYLFPEIPKDHPALSAMIMNISANMLGLGNAATPFGLKAMEELENINPRKGVASNAMCTFLAVNTAGLTLIPTTAIAIRAAAGSTDPTIIIGTSIFGALCATITGVTAAKILEKFYLPNFNFINWLKRNIKTLLLMIFLFALFIVTVTSGIISNIFNFLDSEIILNILQHIAKFSIPIIIVSFVLFGLFKKVSVYEVFIDGAKDGFKIGVKIIPYLVAMIVAIGIFRAGGAMEFLSIIVSPVTNLIGMPVEALPMAFMRPLSGSGSTGVMADIISTFGADSFLGVLVSTMFGSTETTFYVIALYFGSVNIKKIRHSLAAGLLADIAGILAALFIVKLLFGV